MNAACVDCPILILRFMWGLKSIDFIFMALTVVFLLVLFANNYTATNKYASSNYLMINT